jgi:uncharacterized protein YggT (Ycf19 family)
VVHLDVVIYIVTVLLAIYALLIVARAVLSLLRLEPGSLVFRAEHLTSVLTDPYLRVFRRILPVSRFGWPARRDFSSLLGLIVLFIVIQVLARI